MTKINPDALECPECHSDWRSSEIPRDSLAKGYYGHKAPCQKLREWDEGYDENVPCTCPVRWYSRLIGIELPYGHPDYYDGVSQWLCPDCGAKWNRWTGEVIAA